MRSMDRWLVGLTGVAIVLAAALVYRAHRQNDAPGPLPEVDPVAEVRQVEPPPRATPRPASPVRMVLATPPDGVRCYGETAVRVTGNAYTQAVGSDGRPMRCVAGKVLMPGR